MLRAEDAGRVLFPALMMEGAGKQNAVVVIVVRRYAGLLVVAILRLLSSSVVTMITARPPQAATVTATNFTAEKRAWSYPFRLSLGDDLDLVVIRWPRGHRLAK